jgi:hypothetical protein
MEEERLSYEEHVELLLLMEAELLGEQEAEVYRLLATCHPRAFQAMDEGGDGPIDEQEHALMLEAEEEAGFEAAMAAAAAPPQLPCPVCRRDHVRLEQGAGGKSRFWCPCGLDLTPQRSTCASLQAFGDLLGHALELHTHTCNNCRGVPAFGVAMVGLGVAGLCVDCHTCGLREVLLC